MVEEVAEALKGKVDVSTVMVDRICVERKVTPDSIAVSARPFFLPSFLAGLLLYRIYFLTYIPLYTHIQVVCEPYEGEMVVILQSNGPPGLPVPFKGNHVRYVYIHIHRSSSFSSSCDLTRVSLPFTTYLYTESLTKRMKLIISVVANFY